MREDKSFFYDSGSALLSSFLRLSTNKHYRRLSTRMPYVGFLSGAMGPMEFDEDKKDFSLLSKKFKSNNSIKQFSKNASGPGKQIKGDEDEAELDEMLKNIKGSQRERINYRNRNITFENVTADLEKQRKKEKLLNWRDRELFVDKNRAVNVTMGETDNKKALDQRKKQLLKEKRKYGLEEDEEHKLPWEIYYNNAEYYGKLKNFESGLKTVDQALGALMRDKIEQVPTFDPKGIPRCLILRSELLLLGNEPRLALDDLKEVMAEEPNNLQAFCIKARCMFMISDFEKSLLLWHKARMLREKSTEVNEAIENINRTIIMSMAGCFSSPDTDDIIKEMIQEFGSVDAYLESIKDKKEMLSDPNKNLTPAEIRLGKGTQIKTLTKTEEKHEKILLGSLYKDKQFLRTIFDRAEKAEFLQEMSEEGFLFLTGRSEFWRNQKPIYATLNERLQQRM